MPKPLTTKMLLIFITAFLQLSCISTDDGSAPEAAEAEKIENDLSPNIEIEDLWRFKWLNAPQSFEIYNGMMKVVAEEGTDFFNNPVDGKKTSTAHFFHQDFEGDFIAKALVRPDFAAMWNAVALMVYIDDDNWIKFAFENSDATGKSVVSVVTKEVSDDANGPILNYQDQLWLKLIRKDNSYAMFWSIDGDDFKMARLCTLPPNDIVKIGVEFQSPVGQSATHELKYLDVESVTVEDLRKGE